MKKAVLIICILLFTFSAAASLQAKELIQVAILLDTSNSMDGLIEQAKSQLWKIINELALAKKDGKSPVLEVALYEYGNDRLEPETGYIRRVVPLTTDLDRISDELFKLVTDGGEEFCGQVIKKADTELKWDSHTDVLKIIYIAGNEPFTQGTINYIQSCRAAIKNNIIINTIFCGDYQEGITTKWKDGADLADGEYINIDQNQKIAYIEAPQDKEIIKLNEELNQTYLGYGSLGKNKKQMQAKQDANAKGVSSEVIAQRAITKSSAQYNNSSWDLIDAVKNKTVKAEELEDDELPEEMKKMSPQERETYLKKMQTKREGIQKKIQKLNDERRKYVNDQVKKQNKHNTLDEAIIRTIHKQAVKNNYSFSK